MGEDDGEIGECTRVFLVHERYVQRRFSYNNTVYYRSQCTLNHWLIMIAFIR